MLNKTKTFSIALAAMSLSACISLNPYSPTSQTYFYDNKPMYPEVYEDRINYSYQSPPEKKEVVVPESYHVGAYHSPTSFKDRDRNWVNSQNPQGYTIELANGEQPAQVARKLYKAPKSERMAQIKYEQNGKTYYKGLYGSYNSYEAAQQALSSLPEDVRSGAEIKSWGNVQQ